MCQMGSFYVTVIGPTKMLKATLQLGPWGNHLIYLNQVTFKEENLRHGL